MLSFIQKLAGRYRAAATAGSPIQGYLDERARTHVAGWVRNLDDPTERLAFEVVVVLPAATRLIAEGVADQFSPVLQTLLIGDARYAFRVDFPSPLTALERDHLVVRVGPLGRPLELAPQMQGYVDERSIHHVAGWLRHRSETDEKLAYEVVLARPDGERTLATGVADEFNPVLAQLSIGDGAYGFRVIFHEILSEADLAHVVVRAVGSRVPLELAPNLVTVFEPVSHVAMDIVNNCNLRCPFCVFDYSNTRHTEVMSEATFASALRLIPYVSDGNFWLSCLHEATMHPALTRFIEQIPRQWRRKVMYTTNLARPMPDAYFDALADSGLHHINISLESLDAAIYERMRKGARWRIFARNLDLLLAAFRRVPEPPRLRYNVMAYRSNLAEIPDLVTHLLSERMAWQVEVRHTFAVPHIPDEFREAEFLDAADWAWLGGKLGGYPKDQVLLIPPPDCGIPDGGATDPVPRFVTRPLNIRMEWDGKLIVYGEWTGATGDREHVQFLVTNIHHLRDPRQFLVAL